MIAYGILIAVMLLQFFINVILLDELEQETRRNQRYFNALRKKYDKNLRELKKDYIAFSCHYNKGEN